MNERGQGLVEYAIPLGLLFLIAYILVSFLFAAPIQDVVDGVNMIKHSIETGNPIASYDNYTGLPRTKHAQEAHVDEEWNVETISHAFDTGRCKPQINVCEGRTFHHCEIEDGVDIGLVIGKTIEVVVTGFASFPGYWENCGD